MKKPQAFRSLSDTVVMRTILLFLILCVTLTLGFYAQTSEDSMEPTTNNNVQLDTESIHNSYPFYFIQDKQNGQSHVVFGATGFHTLKLNLVKIDTVAKNGSRTLASVESELSYKLSVIKEDVKTVSQADLNHRELQLQIVAP